MTGKSGARCSGRVCKSERRHGYNFDGYNFDLTKPPARTIIKNMGNKRNETQPNSELRENLGKLLLDLSKLTFASFILGGILKGELPQYLVIAAGCVVFVILAVSGLAFTSQKKNRR